MLKRILGPEAAEALEADSPEPLRDARLAVPTPMLDLVMRDGRVESFGYAYLSRVRFDPRGRLLLYFGDDVAVIEGRNLEDIRQKVRMHKASEIYEGIEAEEALKPESAAHVERIYLASAKEEEQHHDTGRGKGIGRQ
jgi:hypothetical protein